MDAPWDKIKIFGAHLLQYEGPPPKGPKPKEFEYFDSPDGQDIFPKLWLVLKPAALVAFATSTVDVILYSKPKGYLQTLGRYAHFTFPILAASTAFVITHNMAGSIRGKDDKLNWALGGAAPGMVYGVWKKTAWGGFFLAVLGGLLGTGKKYCVQNGYAMLMPEPACRRYGGIWSVRSDWTLTKDRPRNWTTGKEE